MNLNDIQGWFDFQNIYNRVAQEVPQGGTIIELGVWRGKSLIYLAQAVKRTGKRMNVIGIDNFKHSDWDGYSTIQRIDRELGETRPIIQQCRENLAAFGVADAVTLIESDSIEAARLFEDRSVDFVFVDDTHNSQHIKEELEAWLPKIKRPAWIAGHDYPGLIASGVLHHFPNAFQDGNSWVGYLE